MTDQCQLKMLSVREATLDDRYEIWEWWNDPITREMMRQNSYVPWEDHVRWFDVVLADSDRILCVGQLPEGKVGVVRFDLRDPLEYEVSINFNPKFRGQGLAPAMLEGSINYLLSIREVKKVWAGCKARNIPSQRSFARAQFTFVNKPGYTDGELYCERIL